MIAPSVPPLLEDYQDLEAIGEGEEDEDLLKRSPSLESAATSPGEVA